MAGYVRVYVQAKGDKSAVFRQLLNDKLALLDVGQYPHDVTLYLDRHALEALQNACSVALCELDDSEAHGHWVKDKRGEWLYSPPEVSKREEVEAPHVSGEGPQLDADASGHHAGCVAGCRVDHHKTRD